jgi:hypothetical protein
MTELSTSASMQIRGLPASQAGCSLSRSQGKCLSCRDGRRSLLSYFPETPSSGLPGARRAVLPPRNFGKSSVYLSRRTSRPVDTWVTLIISSRTRTRSRKTTACKVIDVRYALSHQCNAMDRAVIRYGRIRISVRACAIVDRRFPAPVSYSNHWYRCCWRRGRIVGSDR